MVKRSIKTLDDASDELKILGIPGYFLGKSREGANRERLFYRRSLPPKPWHKTKKWHQQEIAMGSYINPFALRQAIIEAIKIEEKCVLGIFSWEPYLRKRFIDDFLLVENLISKAEEKFFEDKEDNPRTRSSWKSDYGILKKLLQEEYLTDNEYRIKKTKDGKPQKKGPYLTEGLILRVIKGAALNTEDRSKRFYVLQRFIQLANLDIKLDPKLKGKVQRKPRNLPQDELIEEWYCKISDPVWRFIYAILAVYGLRPHEFFYANFEPLRRGEDYIEIVEDQGPDKPKTGARKVYPLYPEWISLFNLRHAVDLPKFNTEGKANQQLSPLIINPLKQKFGVPFGGYDLRHAYARRSIDCGVPDSESAKWMGHTITKHMEYLRWISAQDSQRFYESVKKNPHRRKPPSSTES